MAKAFYTEEEAQAALNTDESGLKAYVEEGRLTPYRDVDSTMYKGSQVEQLAGELGGGDDIGLSDTGGPIGLADSGGPGASGSAISMADSDDSYGGLATDLGDSTSGSGVMASDDTGSFALTDTGMSSGMSGSASGGAGGTSAGSLSGASASGITIFEDDDADPSAQTNIGASGSSDQVNLEGIGSGSGLLDLTQEPDDTSFGAETFDEIMPEGSMAGGTVAGYVDSDDDIVDTSAQPAGTRAVGVAYEPYDPSAPIFGGLAGGAAVAVLVGLLAIALSALNASPGFLSFLYDDNGVNTVMALALLAGLPILGLIVGFVGGKMASSD